MFRSFMVSMTSLCSSAVNAICGWLATASRSASVIANGKRTFWAQIDQPLEAAYETAGRAMVADLAGEDAAEGIDAFLGKRSPVWRS